MRVDVDLKDWPTSWEAAVQLEIPETTVERLVREREPVYSQADVTVWSRDVPHDKIVDECLEALYKKLCAGRATQDGDSLGATS